jgi:glycosyltransferase involved in cell wall biosynthesis
MKIKVIFIQDSLANAGTENSLLNILPYFSEKIEYKVVYLYPQHELLQKYQQAAIPTVFLDLKGKYDFLNGFLNIKKLFKSEKPDLVVSSLLRSNLLSRTVCKSMGISILGTLVSDSYHKDAIETKGFSAKLKFRFFWSLDKFTASIPELFIANSEAIAASHKSSLGISPERTKVIYRGRIVPEKAWSPKNSTESTFNFFSYGRLIPLKGYRELINAFSEVQKKFPSSTLTIYGEGHFRNSLEKQIENLNLSKSVSLPGVHNNVTEELYKYDCFVFPSWYEGFSGALVEAMLSGIPIIASDISMNLEAVKDKETALTFEVKNTQMLEQKMIFAIENPDMIKKIGAKARTVSIERFDIKTIAKQYEETLMKVFHKKNKSIQ